MGRLTAIFSTTLYPSLTGCPAGCPEKPTGRLQRGASVRGGVRRRVLRRASEGGNPAMGDLAQEMYARARRAFETIEFWPQDRVDEMVAAVGWELQKDTVAREVVQLAMEAGLGVFEDKVAKQKNKVRGALWDMRGAKTCGVVEVDSRRGPHQDRQADRRPWPTLCPAPTPPRHPPSLGLRLLKTRNAMIVSPIPPPGGGAAPDHGVRPKSPGEGRGARGPLPVHRGADARRRRGAHGCVRLHDRHRRRRASQDRLRRRQARPSPWGRATSWPSWTRPWMWWPSRRSSPARRHSTTPPAARWRMPLPSTRPGMTDCSPPSGPKGATSARQTSASGSVEHWRPDGRGLNREIVARSARQIATLAGLRVPETTRFLLVIGSASAPRIASPERRCRPF